MTLVTSVLIANRGEIARRIIRTARRLGIRTIAVFSDADRQAPHVSEADEAVFIGASPPRESYLVGETILAAARRAEAQAIHPGYGFLSENADFAEAVQAAGLVWVGPPPAAIRAMGLKDAAKRLMAAAGVPVTPGYLGEDQSPAVLAAQADLIGWPVLIKAVAGGGGKGMRAVHGPEDFLDALASARREAMSAFGDDRVLLEKLIPSPRHIEVQIFADSHGGAVHLFERDCSLQRRHQKVIEEAPAPGMDGDTRAALCEAALRAARAVSYEGAGTVEFIADASGGLRADRVWFMEMNTRLQVEHPVTEAVTGIDLVEWQLRIASGEALPLEQGAIRLNGHAIEARLYAEDPRHGFLPSVGSLDHFKLPDGVRVDSGVQAGGAITPFYDPMIAKLISHADTREAAASQLAGAARAVEIWPVKTNAAFLARCIAHPDFIAGKVETSFIEARLQNLVETSAPAISAGTVARLIRWEAPETTSETPSPWDAGHGLAGFRMNAAPARTARVYLDGRAIDVDLGLKPEAEEGALVRLAGEWIVFAGGEGIRVSLTRPPEAQGGFGLLDGIVRTPMPGRIVSVAVAVGDMVSAGQVLVVLEAMKMEHGLVAATAGRIMELSVAVGEQVTEGFAVCRIESIGPDHP